MKILLVDSHKAYRRLIRSLVESRFEFYVCGEATDTMEAVHQSRELKPDLIIMEFDSPLRQGLEAARSLRQSLIDVPMIILSLYCGKELIEAIRAIGVQGYVDKMEAAHRLGPAIEAVLEGQSFFPADC